MAQYLLRYSSSTISVEMNKKTTFLFLFFISEIVSDILPFFPQQYDMC